MIYAIDSINKREDLLPNVVLGYDISPTCNSEAVTLGSMLSLVKGMEESEYESGCDFGDKENIAKVVAVIGPTRSAESSMVATVGRLGIIPVISYSATSDELSDFERFPFFFRTAPADRFQVRLIADFT